MATETCSSCAFRKGCETYEKEPYNRLKSMIAALGLVPFFCHRGFDWKNTKGMMPPAGARNVCEGWKAEVQKLKAKGHYADPEIRKLRKIAAGSALVSLETFCDSKDKEKKEEALGHMYDMMHLLTH
jgi:hypothetical protein